MGTILINGNWVDAVGGETIDVVNPSTGEVFSKLSRGKAEDVDRAVQAARQALEGEWGRLSATERGRLLCRLGQLILDNAEDLAQIEARDTGKPLTVARNDVKVVARYFEFYGSAADKIHGQTIP
jgi:aldehyde dehydrogenase (NAD+)